MIFVTVGTALPFDRLVAAADALAVDEAVLVQCGASSLELRHAERVPFLPFDDVARLMREARVVVAHAGAGSVVTALLASRCPIVVPRRHALGEAVDDHQVAFAERLARLGLARLVLDPAELRAAVDDPGGSAAPAASASPLASDLQAYLTASVSRPRR
jgi:UDP-N-acetylglucosamine transferase subunit ALG13